MRWVLRIGMALVVVAGAAWILRGEIVLSGVSRAIGDQSTVGPNQPVNWSSGEDLQGRDPSERRPNVVLILADDLGMVTIQLDHLT